MRLKVVLPLLAALCLLVPAKAHASAETLIVCWDRGPVRDLFGRQGWLWYCETYFDDGVVPSSLGADDAGALTRDARGRRA